LPLIFLDTTVLSVDAAKKAGREPSMTFFASLRKRKYFCLVILFMTFAIFTADIIDLREELQILSYSYNSLDNNITTGVTDPFLFDPVPILTLSPIHCTSSVVASSSHLPPCGFRAPPFQS
jgi:hypothetical protein